MRTAILALLVLASILCLGSTPAICDEKTITDMDGRTVTISEPIERVVAAGYSMPTCVMAAFGLEDKIVGVGGCVYPKTSGNQTTTADFLIPALNDMPEVGRGSSLNIEAAAALDPDIIILERTCAGQGAQLTQYSELIQKLELFNESIPLVVINNGACANPPTPDNIYQGIEILGELFDKQERAEEIIDFLKEEVDMVQERTDGIEEDEKPSVLFGCLVAWSSNAEGNLFSAMPDYDCSTLYPGITNIKNAYKEEGRAYLSAEQLLALNPDVIIVGFSRLEWKSADIYNETEYGAIQSINAIKNRRVYSTGQLELWQNNAGLEFPIEMLIEAKAAYPDRFEDVNMGEQLTMHYKTIYGLDDEQAEELKKCVHLDWMDEEGF